jgi:hypothetical protein
MTKPLLGLVLLIGCGSSDPPPSCQQAMTHFYGAGCSYFDSTTSPPTPIAQSTMINFCQTAAVNISPTCRDELDGWLACNDQVPDHATNADCDCSSSYMVLLECR